MKKCPKCKSHVLKKEEWPAEQSGNCPVYLVCSNCGYDEKVDERKPA